MLFDPNNIEAMKSIVDNTLYHTWISLNQQHFPTLVSEGGKERLLYTHALTNLFGKSSSVLQLFNHTDQSFEFLSENIQTLLGYELDTSPKAKCSSKCH